MPETRSEIAQPSLNAVATNAIPEFRPLAVPAADDVSVREMQSYLKIGGFYDRDLDGIAGSGTQAGIKEFVQSRGLDLDAGNPEAVLAALQNDPALRQRMAGIIREGMAADPDQAAALQTILTAQGHDTQGIDGKVGNNTRMAYNEYATENDLSHAIYPIVATADTAKMGAINLHDRSVISPSYNTRSDHVAATGYNHEVAQGPTMRSNGMPINDPAIPQSPDVTLTNDMPAIKPQTLSI
ncbi:MAG: hypothetical protein CO093_11310 [Alphaproteobacteria bacterium CG_4_9_14_3_um_filter_47_13]|nr:MAG: hypothetical protein CO093_11310 [Alphaproteobacteria bacterium CG_4_9_14_3_um_filter_47_13]